MLIVPAVDILGGKCVRLVQGDPKRLRVYLDNPSEAVRLWTNQGAEIIHLIDLDAAIGSGQNIGVIKEILKNLQARIQIGGGIRTLEKAETLLKLGAYQVIFGTAAVETPLMIKEAICRYGSRRVAVAVDERNCRVISHGWKEQSKKDYIDLARSFEAMEVGRIIFTSTSVDGTLKGPNVEKIVRLVESLETPVIASGGIASLDDLTMLACTGVEGVIIGTALYEGKFTFEQALDVVRNVS